MSFLRFLKMYFGVAMMGGSIASGVLGNYQVCVLLGIIGVAISFVFKSELKEVVDLADKISTI